MLESHSHNVPRNIVLVGFMGSGKSTIGRALARKLVFELIDLDVEIVRGADGKPITRIFEDEGESGFRQRERQALEALAGHRSGKVIATGGGIVGSSENRRLLKSLRFVVWLSADPEVIFERISKNRDRPLLHTENPKETVRQLLAERTPLYAETSDIEINTSGLSMEEVAFGIKESAIHFFRCGGDPRNTGPLVD